MIKLLRTNAQDTDFIELVKQLDSELIIKDGDDHPFYNQFNQLDAIKHVVVVYEDKIPLGCGAMKPYNATTMEIKRMFTIPGSRGKGIASIVLSELEKWAAELSFKKCILETGIGLHDAIGLYQKNGYQLIPNYGPYSEVENSKCFEKIV
jgi:putative acetyltransferase